MIETAFSDSVPIKFNESDIESYVLFDDLNNNDRIPLTPSSKSICPSSSSSHLKSPSKFNSPNLPHSPPSPPLSCGNHNNHRISSNSNNHQRKTKYLMNESISIHINPRSHLEVADKKHRYGKNLRYYFQEYSRIFNEDLNQVVTSPTCTLESKWKIFDDFFRWLDESKPLPNVSSCNNNSLRMHVVFV